MNEIKLEFYDSLLKHIDNVQIAGRIIGVPEELLRKHDRSKWGPVEDDGYAEQFFGGGSPEKFPKAWLHHIHHNPHHWQYWIFPDGWTMEGSAMDGAAIEMSEYFALEMIADWHGREKSKYDRWDSSEWLAKNHDKMVLHHKTIELIHFVMIDLGYILTDNCPWSFAWLGEGEPIG